MQFIILFIIASIILVSILNTLSIIFILMVKSINFKFIICPVVATTLTRLVSNAYETIESIFLGVKTFKLRQIQLISL